MNKQRKHIKTCPQCGHDIFRVAKTWWGRERYSQSGRNRYRKEIIDEKQEEYIVIECDACHSAIGDADDLCMQSPQ